MSDEALGRGAADQEHSDDLTSVDGILAALYDSISGPPERKRDVRRFRSLFVDGARLIRADGPPSEEGGARPAVMEPDEFFRAACEYFKTAGFYESEVARRADSFGRVTHVLSTYESRHAPGEEPFARGVNSIQLFHDGARYWVVTVFWDAETPGNPVPSEYLP